jgi:hypothetical protein
VGRLRRSQKFLSRAERGELARLANDCLLEQMFLELMGDMVESDDDQPGDEELGQGPVYVLDSKGAVGAGWMRATRHRVILITGPKRERYEVATGAITELREVSPDCAGLGEARALVWEVDDESHCLRIVAPADSPVWGALRTVTAPRRRAPSRVQASSRLR